MQTSYTQRCTHPLKNRSYGWVLVGLIHHEVEFCRKCQRFCFLLNPLKGWLVLAEKSRFEEAIKRLRSQSADPAST
jgi:hypothetical protein